MDVNIIAYSIKADADKSVMTVDFLIENKAISPKDYEPVYQGLLDFCEHLKRQTNAGTISILPTSEILRALPEIALVKTKETKGGEKMEKSCENNGVAKFAKKELIGRDLLEMRAKAFQMVHRLQMPIEIDDDYPFVSKGELAIIDHLQTIVKELEEAFVDFGIWKYGIKNKSVYDDMPKDDETPKTDEK